MARQVSKTAEEVKRRAREKRKPKPAPKPTPVKSKSKPKVTGKAGMVKSIKKPVLDLRSNKNSKLYKMQPREFHSWFKGKYKVDYPYNVSKQSIGRKSAKTKKKKKKG